MIDRQKTAREAAESIRNIWPGRPEFGIVLGSGLSSNLSVFEPELEIPYTDVPGLGSSDVEGHRNRFLAARCSGRSVLLALGRLHLYEGYGAFESALPVAVMGELGVRTAVLTNAAGGIRGDLRTGDIVAISDHLNLQNANALAGFPGPRKFTDMTNAYDLSLYPRLSRAFGIRKGVYAALPGPSYETRAEIRFLKKIGADLAGMSTAQEAIMARFYGMKTIGFSVVTNSHAAVRAGLSHEDVVTAGQAANDRLMAVLKFVIENSR